MGVVIPVDTNQTYMPDYFKVLLTKTQIWALCYFKFNLHSDIF
jgi:hypothetical protein